MQAKNRCFFIGPLGRILTCQRGKPLVTLRASYAKQHCFPFSGKDLNRRVTRSDACNLITSSDLNYKQFDSRYGKKDSVNSAVR